MMPIKNECEETINQWLEKTIIGLNLCPFAKMPYLAKAIRISSTTNDQEETMVHFFLDELNNIQSNPKIATSLVCFEKCEMDFFEFNDLVGVFELLLTDLNLDLEFQLVCFHPKFVFDGLNADERVNYVNRSPYPLVHIIRSLDIENALKSPEEGEQISKNNEKTLNQLDDAGFHSHFPLTPHKK